MIEPRFRVHREGKGIVIKGTVPVSVQRHAPYLEHIPDPNPTVRSYRLDYHNVLQGEAETGVQTEEIEYRDSELVSTIRTLRFKLGEGKEITLPNEPEPEAEEDMGPPG